MKRRHLLSALSALSLAPLTAVAQSTVWPTRVVRIVLPSAPGGPWDPLTRLLADRLGTVYGQPFIVENRSGATGMLGMDVVAKATDGHTLGVIFMPHMLTPSLFKKLPYDILRDVVPVTQTQWTYNLLVVNPTLPVKTLDQLVAYGRQRPGKLTLLSGGNGSPAHVMGEYFKQLTKSYIVHVPYRGPVAALQDLIGGQGDLMFANITAAVPHIRSGRLRAIAVTSQQRLQIVPEVPTFAELGQPRFDVRDWAGIVASSSVPAGVLPRLNEEIRKVLVEPAVVERFAEMGLYLHGSSSAELAKLMRSEGQKWGEVIRVAGIRIDN
jgi:tripartite-type tricarboxylate transporter receptor subunit TctC